MAATLKGRKKYRSTDCGVCAFIRQRMQKLSVFAGRGHKPAFDGF